jgi:hypothetical protein
MNGETQLSTDAEVVRGPLARRTSLRAARFRDDVPGKLDVEIAPSS